MMRKLGKALLWTIGGLSATAVVNRVLAGSADELGPPLSGEPATYTWRGLDVAYTEAGDPDDRDLLLYHGIHAAATSHEFDRAFNRLAADFHVIAPDLPGFGRSDRPPMVYSAPLYRSFVEEFADEVAEDPVVVASSLTGAYAADAAADVDPERLVLVCPSTSGLGGRRLWVRTLLRSPVVGTALFNALVSKPSIRYNMADQAYYDPAALSDDELTYLWRSAHQGGARYAPASFVSGYLDPDVDLAATIADLDVPVTLVWGREATTVPLREGRDLADETGARLVVFDDAKLLPHAEHPGEFVGFVREELGVEA